MFWRRPKPRPLWVRAADASKHTLMSMVAIATAVTTLFAYIHLDTSDFERTTEMIAASDGEAIYVQWSIASKITEHAVLVYYLEGEQIGHYHYDETPVGSFIHTLRIPPGIKAGQLDFFAEWSFRGVTTAFLNEGLKFVTKVEVPNANTSTSYSVPAMDHAILRRGLYST